MSEMRTNSPPRVLMVGPALTQRGGIAAVEQAYHDAWDNDRYQMQHVATYATHHGMMAAKVWNAIRSLARVALRLAMTRPDIVHVHISQKGSFIRKAFVIAMSRTVGVHAIILHMHGSHLHSIYDTSGELKRLWIRAVVRSADRLIVLGPRWRDFYATLASSMPIDILPNPVVCPAEGEQYGERPPVVLTLGELGERKGTYDTLRAIPAIVTRHPDAEFWLGGDGAVEQVKTLVAEEPWGGHVKLLGWVERNAKTTLFAKARMFLLPTHHEGFPVALIEAMAHALPVITTPVGDIPEAVADGETGFLVAPGDVEAIEDRVCLLLREPELAKRIGRQARIFAYRTYDIHAIMPRLYEIYDLAVSRA